MICINRLEKLDFTLDSLEIRILIMNFTMICEGYRFSHILSFQKMFNLNIVFQEISSFKYVNKVK